MLLLVALIHLLVEAKNVLLLLIACRGTLAKVVAACSTIVSNLREAWLSKRGSWSWASGLEDLMDVTQLIHIVVRVVGVCWDP